LSATDYGLLARFALGFDGFRQLVKGATAQGVVWAELEFQHVGWFERLWFGHDLF
jgi:hypothetical protein